MLKRDIKRTIKLRHARPPRSVIRRDLQGRWVQDANGVRVRVLKTRDGSVVEASCNCFGSSTRAHSNPHCPNIARS